MKQVGRTPLVASDAIARLCGVDRVLLKLEHANPTGTHKDRAARAIVTLASRLGYRSISLGSCGNLGVAVARACAVSDMQCAVFVPASFAGHRIEEIRRYGGNVVRATGRYEEAVEASKQFARETACFDGNPDGVGAEVTMEAYASIGVEIYEEAGDVSSVWVPVGNGTTIAGVARGFDEHAGMLPRIGAVGSAGNTAATAGRPNGGVVELDQSALSPSPVNEALVNRVSLHAALVVKVVMESRGWFSNVSDAELIAAADVLTPVLDRIVHPVGAAGLAGLLGAGPFDEAGTHVVVITA